VLYPSLPNYIKIIILYYFILDYMMNTITNQINNTNTSYRRKIKFYNNIIIY
jgi:hypothetical protein